MSESGNAVIAESTLALIRADLDAMKSALCAEDRTKVEEFSWAVRVEPYGDGTRERMALMCGERTQAAVIHAHSTTRFSGWIWIGLIHGPLWGALLSYEGRTEPTREEYTNGAPERLRAQCASVAEYAINRVVTR